MLDQLGVAFIEGGFMDYNGTDAGSEAFYRRVVGLRKTQPALYEGACDYIAVKPTAQATATVVHRND